MAKETMKAKIERLERELAEERLRNVELSQKIFKMMEEADNNFQNSPYFKQLEQEIASLQHYKDGYEGYRTKYFGEREKNVLLREEIQKMKEEQPQKVYNERNAGRKALEVQPEVLENMVNDQKAGMSYRKLAKKYGFSVGSVHKLINKQD